MPVAKIEPARGISPMDFEAGTLTVLQNHPHGHDDSVIYDRLHYFVDRQIPQPLLSSRIRICNSGEWFHSHSVGLRFVLLT